MNTKPENSTESSQINRTKLTLTPTFSEICICSDNNQFKTVHCLTSSSPTVQDQKLIRLHLFDELASSQLTACSFSLIRREILKWLIRSAEKQRFSPVSEQTVRISNSKSCDEK